MRWLQQLLGPSADVLIEKWEEMPKKRVPVAGEMWELFTPDASPWPGKGSGIVVRIIDQQGGWVRYYLNKMCDDERKPLDEFLRVWRFSHRPST